MATKFACLHSPVGTDCGAPHWRLEFGTVAQAVEFYGRFERRARALVRLYHTGAGVSGEAPPSVRSVFSGALPPPPAPAHA